MLLLFELFLFKLFKHLLGLTFFTVEAFFEVIFIFFVHCQVLLLRDLLVVVAILDYSKMTRDRCHFATFVGALNLALIGAYGLRPRLEISGFYVLTTCAIRWIIVVILLLSTICGLGLLLHIILLMLLMLHIILQITQLTIMRLLSIRQRRNQFIFRLRNDNMLLFYLPKTFLDITICLPI